jgi:hypothetical protein
MFTRERIRSWLTAVGAIALILAVLPSAYHEGGVTANRAQMEHLQANPQDMPARTDVTLGWQPSPLFRYRSQTELLDKNGAISASRSVQAKLGWLSWSSATLAVGLGLLWVARRLQTKPQSDAEASGAQPLTGRPAGP